MAVDLQALLGGCQSGENLTVSMAKSGNVRGQWYTTGQFTAQWTCPTASVGGVVGSPLMPLHPWLNGSRSLSLGVSIDGLPLPLLSTDVPISTTTGTGATGSPLQTATILSTDVPSSTTTGTAATGSPQQTASTVTASATPLLGGGPLASAAFITPPCRHVLHSLMCAWLLLAIIVM